MSLFDSAVTGLHKKERKFLLPRAGLETAVGMGPPPGREEGKGALSGEGNGRAGTGLGNVTQQQDGESLGQRVLKSSRSVGVFSSYRMYLIYGEWVLGAVL